MNVDLHVEQVVLVGIELAPAQRALLQAALEGELAMLLGDGLPGLDASALLAGVQAPQIEVGDHPDPARLGREIAQSLYAGIT